MEPRSLLGSSRPLPTPTDRGALFGLGLYRVVTATWAVVVALIDARSGSLVEPSLAFAILGPLLAWSVLTTVFARRSPQTMLTPVAQGIDLAFGVAVVAAEWVTYDGDHPLRFGAMWQLAPIVATGLSYGALGGLLAGVGLGLVNGVTAGLTEGFDGRILALVSAVVLFGVAGAASGAVMDRLRRAEDDLAEARARERVARTLHDGVLQTLAAVQRRSDDDSLVALAADQDRVLRRWLRQDRLEPPARALADQLERLAEDLRRRDGTPISVVVVEAPQVDPAVADALVGAVGEAITNAVKHGAPNRVTVFLDEDDDGETLINAAAQRLGMGRSVVCTVHDDGVGFDPEHTAGGMGIVHSMRAPVEAVGGSVTIRSGPQTGTEVEFRLNGRARPQRRRS